MRATILHFPMYLHSVSGIESKSCHVLSVVGQEEDHLTRWVAVHLYMATTAHEYPPKREDE